VIDGSPRLRLTIDTGGGSAAPSGDVCHRGYAYYFGIERRSARSTLTAPGRERPEPETNATIFDQSRARLLLTKSALPSDDLSCRIADIQISVTSTAGGNGHVCKK
jgi:hypothetical protein